MDTYMLIREAIRNRRIVVATYRGRRRELCPHVIGIGPGGNEQALFYQFGGESSSPLGPEGSEENWRCMSIADLQHVAVQEGAWVTAPNYHGSQTCVTNVDLAVDD